MTNQNCLIQKMFENRGYTSDFFYEINNPDYDVLKDIDTLVAELKDIHDSNIVLTVYPDFDMDGVAAGSCGFAGFAELGFNVRLYIPDPSKGYGISADSIDDVLLKNPDTQVIITCDTGIGCADAANRCAEHGIKFFVTDHHKQLVSIPADVIVDPMRADESYAHPFICGAFVMHQVLQRYANLYCNSFMQEQIRRLRVFAGIGTISDTMPLLYENRQVVKDAVGICKFIYGDGEKHAVSAIPGCDVYRRAFWGLYELLKVYEGYGVISSPDDINEDFFGFYLAPSVNAVKRMDGDMTRAFGVFFGNNRSVDMDYLYQLNNERKTEVLAALKTLLSISQPYAPYIYYSDARSGILGLIAQKLETESGLPTLVVTKGTGARSMYHGSGRSPEWYPCLTKLSDKIFVGGHEGSFGCGINSNEELISLYQFLMADVPAVMETVEFVEAKPDFVISTDWTKDIGIDIPTFENYLQEIEFYRPFGKGFPAPVAKLVFHNRDVVTPKDKKSGWEVMGKAKQHLKIHLANGFEVICWNQAYLISQKDSFDEHAVIGNLKFSEFRGVRSVVFDGTLMEQ